MGLLDILFSSRRNQTKNETLISKKDLRKTILSADFKKNPPVIKITPSETRLYPRHAIIRPEGNVRNIKMSLPLCFHFYEEINSQFPTQCGGCGLSLETLEKGIIESPDGKVVALIEFVGFVKDPEHFKKKWSVTLQ